MNYEIIFYETKTGEIPVEEYILSLPIKSQAKVYKSLQILQTYGVETPYPHTSHIEGKIFEVRVKFSSNQYRILYFIDTGKEIILLHGFNKKTREVKMSDITLAKSRMKDYLERKKNENS
jgi:phage-related protein